jgi:RNA polymerase sigma-70 factor (ECF subfamily)
MVNGLAFRLLGRDADLDDVVQESFVQALRGLDGLSDREAFSGWLCSIVVGTAHKALRRRRLLQRLGLRRTLPLDPERVVARVAPPEIAAELRAIYCVVDSMPPSLRIVFILRRVEERALPEIASLVGVSLATVKRRLTAAERLFEEGFSRP